jgi:hypothetical protein
LLTTISGEKYRLWRSSLCAFLHQTVPSFLFIDRNNPLQRIFLRGKAVPLQDWSGPGGSRKLRFPHFMTTAQDGGKVVSLTHRTPLPPGNTPGTHFCYRLSRPQGHSATGRIMSLKNSKDTIGNRTRDLPTFLYKSEITIVKRVEFRSGVPSVSKCFHR